MEFDNQILISIFELPVQIVLSIESVTKKCLSDYESIKARSRDN